MCCAALQVIWSSGRPTPCVSCHGATADLHASDDTQGAIRLEADPVSTRSRPCFYSKQTLFLLEAQRPDGNPHVASLCSGGRVALVRHPESGRIIRHGCPLSETIPTEGLAGAQVMLKPPACYQSCCVAACVGQW